MWSWLGWMQGRYGGWEFGLGGERGCGEQYIRSGVGGERLGVI